MHLVHVAVHEDLQQGGRVVAGPAGIGGFCLEAQTGQVQAIDKNVDHSRGAVFIDVVINAFGKQGGLITVLAFNETAHEEPL